MRKWIGWTPALFVVVLLTAAAQPASAFPCKWCQNLTAINKHTFEGSFACEDLNGGEPLCADCEAFNACHTNEQTGPCNDWHDSCQPWGFGIADVEESAARGDVAKLVHFAKTEPKSLKVVDSGYALVFGCDGKTVIAAYAIDDASIKSRLQILIAAAVSVVSTYV